jgi:hypothetical protein
VKQWSDGGALACEAMERRRTALWAEGGGRRGADGVPGGQLRTADGGSRRSRESSARSAAQRLG